MAEEIVACPGCGKKFRIPEGAPGGTFQCTACNASVPYGKAAPKAGAGGGKGPARSAPAAAAKPGGRGTNAGPAAARHGTARHGSGGHGAAGHGTRRGHAEPDEEGHGHRHGPSKKDRDQKMVLWLSLGGVAVVAAGAFFLMDQKKETPAIVQGPTPVKVPVAQPEPAPVTPAPVPGAGGDPAGGGTATPAPGDGTKPGPASGIGGTQQAAGTAAGWSSDPAILCVRYADVAGVTPQEREAMDKDVVLFCDRDSGKAGVDARSRLKKLGRRAMPPLLSVFAVHWNGSKWESEPEKFASFQVQQLLMDIVKADKPRDFLARFDPRVPVPAKDFETAAKMWTNWWNTKGKDLETYKDFAE